MIDYKSEYKVGGCIPQPKDKRDWKLDKLLTVSAVQLPREYLPDYGDFTYDQGRSSECCACSYCYIRHLQEMDKENQSGFKEPFSPSFQYANRDASENFEGMYLRSACKRGVEGSLPWKYFPNFYSLHKCQEIFQKNRIKFLNIAHPYRISSFYTVNTEQEIKTAVYLTKGVLIGIMITEPFYHPNKDGVIDYSYDNMKQYGGHALCIDGYKYINDKLYLRIKNSWGKNWGVENGHCYISFDDYQKYKIDEGYVLVDEVNELKITSLYPKSHLKAFLDVIIYWLKNVLYDK